MMKRPPNITTRGEISSYPVMMLTVCLVLLSLVITGCHGNKETANHLVLFDTPPEGVPIHRTVPFDIRTNFSGTVQLVESRDFRVVVNITSPSLGQAYDVSTQFVATYDRGMVLEIKQGKTTEDFFNFTWLIVAFALLTVAVAVITGACAIQWYRAEHAKQEYSEGKSYTSSSHRTGTVYRSRNSIPLGGHMGDGLRLEDVIRGEEELRQVREMPEEEEAEAYEMEQIKKLKFKDESDDMTAETEESDPQERNLNKSHIHPHGKTIHKELLKKAVTSSAKKVAPPPPYKRTHLGRYEGIPTHDTDESTDDDYRDRTLPLRGGVHLSRSSDGKMRWSPSSSGHDLRTTNLDDSSTNRSTNSLSTFGRRPPYEKESNLRKSENDLKLSSGSVNNTSTEADPKHLVMADVHPSGKPVVVSITPRDNNVSSSLNSKSSARPGNFYVPPSELKSAASQMSTFGQRTPNTNDNIVTSTPISNPPERMTSLSPTNSVPSSPQTPSRSRPPPPPPPLHSTPTSSSSPTASPSSSTPTTAASLNRQDVTRNFQDNIWGSPGLLSMSDIPEDPREDDQSGISGSQKSASMYGSSEIFEVPENGNTYYNLDSDIDVPPLDSDADLWSDGGLPSPRLWSPRSAAEKGKTNDDIKLIPGALKSPGPNSGRLVVMKPRPNSSIALPSDQSKSPRGKGGNKSLSPPTYEEINYQSNPNTAFEFPPPPTFLQTPDGSEVIPDDDVTAQMPTNASGDYVLIKHDGKDREQTGDNSSASNPDPTGKTRSNGEIRGRQSTNRGGGTGGGKKPVFGPTYMNLTILSTLCVLSLATTGVMCRLLTNQEETRVDVTVFAPAHFLTNQTRVFFNEILETEALGLESVGALVYDVPHPWEGTARMNANWWSPHCNTTCQQGCDETWSQCVCQKGYRRRPDGSCEDVNECMEGKARCDRAAGCYNRKGSYDCICGEGYYGDGKTCRDCERGCPKDHYEEQPCSRDRQKICKACTKSCRHGFYLSQKCGAYENALCRVCQPECGEGEFESRQCTNLHDRVCTNMSKLSLPMVSTNVLMEERSRVRSDRTSLERLPKHYVGFSRYSLHRGTDFSIEMTVRFMNPTPQFLPVNLTQPFDMDLVAPAVLGSFVVQRFCPTPVPDYYVFSYKKHQSLTYKLLNNDSIEACETHRQFGNFLGDSDRDESIMVGGMGGNSGEAAGSKGNTDSFVCAQPGSLTSNFIMDEDFFHARTKWVDKNKRCQRHSRTCESCTSQCSSDMFAGNPVCSIDKYGRDDGISPRLMTCYNCCVKKNCSEACKDYHKRRCQPEQCLNGNLLEFSLKPSFDSSQDSKFFCHIQPVEGQRLLEMDYSVHHASMPNPLYTKSVNLFGDEDWMEKGKMRYSDGILDVTVDSSLGKMPNFVEGSISMANTLFKVGSYKDKGAKFGSAKVVNDYVFLRPQSPTGIPRMPKAQQDCTNHELDEMNLATNMENPYIQDLDLEGVANASLPFIVHHKSKVGRASVTLDKETSLLKRLFSVATLEAKSFRGNVFNNGSHWILQASSAVEECPGYLGVRVQDPSNSVRNIFDMDVVVTCPSTFNLTFTLPTFDEADLYKDIMLVVRDAKAVHHFRLYHTAKNEEKLKRKEPVRGISVLDDETLPYASKQRQPRPTSSPGSIEEGNKTPEFPIDVPYLIIIAGIVVLMLVLSIIGLCFLPDIPETPLVKWYHPIFAILYMVIQFVYSVIVSASVFFLILIVITSPYVKLINQHGQKGGVTSSHREYSRLVLLQLQRHMESEIVRQDVEVDKYQQHCISDVKTVVDDMNTMHQAVLKSTSDVFERHRLDLLLEEQKVFVRQKLSRELNEFREEYLKASKSILRRIRQDAAASYQNVLHNNTWLEGARFLHKAVNLFQGHNKRKVQSFMEWTGINAKEESLDIDLEFSLPALPRLEDIQAPPSKYKQPMKRDITEKAANDRIRSIQVHNNWFFPLADSVLGAVTGYKTSPVEESLTEREDANTMFTLFVVLLVVCDLVLFCHRMTKAWTTARLILFGFPEYFRERKDDENGPDDIFESQDFKNKRAPVTSCRESPWVNTVTMFLTRTISTTFLPKMVGAIAACVVLICLLRVSNTYLTTGGLQQLGIYHNATHSVSLQISVTNGRIQDHAAHINTLEYPSFQALTNSHLNTHKTVFGFYRKQLHGLQNLTTQMYCLHLKDIGIPSNCSDLLKGHRSKADDLAWLRMETLTHACRFQPVIPNIFFREAEMEHPPSEKQVDTLLESLRAIIYYTSHLIIIFLIVIVLKEVAFATLWILLQRSGIIRMRIIVEQDQGDMSH